MNVYEYKKNNELIKEMEAKYLKSLSENINKIRNEKGITIPMLSDRTGLSISYLSKISSNSEKTKKVPTLNSLIKISYGLECSPASLLISDNKEILDIQDMFNKI